MRYTTVCEKFLSVRVLIFIHKIACACDLYVHICIYIYTCTYVHIYTHKYMYVYLNESTQDFDMRQATYFYAYFHLYN